MDATSPPVPDHDGLRTRHGVNGVCPDWRAHPSADQERSQRMEAHPEQTRGVRRIHRLPPDVGPPGFLGNVLVLRRGLLVQRGVHLLWVA